MQVLLKLRAHDINKKSQDVKYDKYAMHKIDEVCRSDVDIVKIFNDK